MTVVLALVYIHRLSPSYTSHLTAFFYTLPLQPSHRHTLHLTTSAIPRDSSLIPAQVIRRCLVLRCPRLEVSGRSSPTSSFVFQSSSALLIPTLAPSAPTHRFTAYHNPTSQSRQPVLLTPRAHIHHVLQSRKYVDTCHLRSNRNIKDLRKTHLDPTNSPDIPRAWRRNHLVSTAPTITAFAPVQHLTIPGSSQPSVRALSPDDSIGRLFSMSMSRRRAGSSSTPRHRWHCACRGACCKCFTCCLVSLVS